jgi:RNA polymerase sigma-70 factor (ECF subfamily)
MTIRQMTDQHLDAVFRFLLAMVRDRETAADLTQETFLRLQRSGRTDGPPSEAYVLATARNTAISWLRRRNLERRHVDVVPPEELDPRGARSRVPAPDREIERRELGSALEAAQADLPEELRCVFHLSEVEGLRYEQIAEVVGCPAGTVASRKHLAVRRLREHLQRSGHAL